MSRNFGSPNPKKEAIRVAELVKKAVGDELGRVAAVAIQEGHEGSPERLAVLENVEMPLNSQIDLPFSEGTLGAELVTLADVTVKFSLDMHWVHAIVIKNDEYRFYYTQQFIDKHPEDLREIAIQVRKAFLDHISESQVGEMD